MQPDVGSMQGRSRGRPREFDRDAALRGAMEIFWRKGFDGTSMPELVEAMGIHSPSIYAAFGSKENLFREALKLYASAEGGTSRRAMEGPGSAKHALFTMLTNNVELFADEARPRGCMIVLGAVNIGLDNAELRAFVQEHRHEVTSLVRRRLSQAADDGELGSNADVDALTALIITMSNGLSIQALDGTPRHLLLRTVEIFIESLPFVEVC